MGRVPTPRGAPSPGGGGGGVPGALAPRGVPTPGCAYPAPTPRRSRDTRAQCTPDVGGADHINSKDGSVVRWSEGG